MRSRVAAAAALSAALGLLAVVLVISRGDDENLATCCDELGAVQVLFAVRAIPAGMTAEDAILGGAVQLRHPANLNDVKLGALGSLQPLIPGIALEAIPAGAQITRQMFGCSKEKWDLGRCRVQRLTDEAD